MLWGAISGAKIPSRKTGPSISPSFMGQISQHTTQKTKVALADAQGDQRDQTALPEGETLVSMGISTLEMGESF